MKFPNIFKTATAAAVGLSLSMGAVVAQDFPADTIRLIVPYAPGGGTDSIARAFAAALEKESGQSVVVENISGSSGINGMLALKNAKPDGYTIAINGGSDVTAPLAFREDPPFALDDFSCAGAVFNVPVWILSHKDNGYTDLGDFLDDARANPGKLTMGITGKLSATDFVASTIKGVSEQDFRVVAFGGGAALSKAVLANQVNAGVILAPVMLNEVKEGDLNVLAAAGDLSGIAHEPIRGTRHIREWGADIEVTHVRGIFMPAGAPAEIQAKMDSLVKASVDSEIFAKFSDTFGYAPYSQSGADFCARLPQEVNDLQTVLIKYLEK